MYCIFDRTLDKQIDDVAIDLPLRLTIVNPLLVYLEQNWLERCPLEYKPFYYQMYVEDIFALFNSPEHLKCFESYLRSRHVNISSTVENKKDNRMSFIDVSIICKQDYKNWHDSYIGIYICFWICSDWTKFHLELVRLMDVFKSNGYSENFTNTFL